jgi:tetratricopeptide (TPR) repeat protein
MLLALRLKEFEWLDKFAEEHSGKLKPEFRENLVSLLKANLYFALGEFEKALEYLNMFRYDIFIYKFDVKNLMLKIYYELGLYFQAYSLIDAYKHFLNNNKEHAKIHNKQYKNFINLYSRLLKIKERGANEDMDMLLNEVEKTEALASRIWLREKFGELQKNVNSCS